MARAAGAVGFRELLEGVCIAVYTADKVTVEFSFGVQDVSLAHIELPSIGTNSATIVPNGSSRQTPSYDNSPYAIHVRDHLRKMLLGNTVTFAPVFGRAVGHLWCCEKSFVLSSGTAALDDGELCVGASLIRQGMVTLRTSANQGGPDRAMYTVLEGLEATAAARGVGIHGATRPAELVRAVKAFPPPDHPYHRLLVQHLLRANIRCSVERILSPSTIDVCITPSYQMVRVRLAGILPPRDSVKGGEAKIALSRTILHRSVALVLDGFDDANQCFWATLVHGGLDRFVVHDLVESGVVAVDHKSLILCRYGEEMAIAEEKAVHSKVGIWSCMESPVVINPTLLDFVCRDELSFTGVVIGVLNEVTLSIAPLDDAMATPTPSDGPLSPASSSKEQPQLEGPPAVRLVRVAYLSLPEPPSNAQITPHGKVVRYSPRSFFGREELRALCIGQVVSVEGIRIERQQATVSSPPMAVVVGRVLLSGAGDVTSLLLDSPSHMFNLSVNGLGYPVPPLPLDLAERFLAKQRSDPGDELVGVPLDLNSPAQQPMDILYVETEAHLAAFLASPESTRLPFEVLLSCIVEEVFVRPNVMFSVYVPSIGITVNFILEGVRFPCGDVLAKTPFGEHLKRFLEHMVQHQTVLISFLRAEGMALVGTMKLPAGGSLAVECVLNGFAIVSGILLRVPPEPSKALLEAQIDAKYSRVGIWRGGRHNSMMLNDVEESRRRETALSRVYSVDDIEMPIKIVPLGWADPFTFTYRHSADESALKIIGDLIETARPSRHQLQVGDLVAAPYETKYYRARILSIEALQRPSDTTVQKEAVIEDETQQQQPRKLRRRRGDDAPVAQMVCTVEYIDYGICSTGVPLHLLRVVPQRDSLGKWPPLARKARHAFLLPPDNTNGDGTLRLHRAVRELLLSKMTELANTPSLSMYRMYIKGGLDHVMLMPEGEGLRSEKCGPFEASLWLQLRSLQDSIRAAFKGKRSSDDLKGYVTLDAGCCEFPELIEWMENMMSL